MKISSPRCSAGGFLYSVGQNLLMLYIVLKMNYSETYLLGPI